MSRTGIVAIMGRPNAGKSTLLNALVGQKLAAVSAKPQTTRGRVRGIVTTSETQLVFCDTPGLHRPPKSRPLNSMMNREAWTGIRDADIGIYLVSVTSGFHLEDKEFLKGVLSEVGDKPLLLLASQTDRLKKVEVEAIIDTMDAAAAEALGEEAWKKCGGGFRAISAKHSDEVQALIGELASLAPEGEWLYPEGDVSDQSVRQMATELIRENLFRCLGEEVPYQVTVVVESWEETPKLIRIGANVIVARPSLKPLVIGKAGAKIKEIGTLSRTTLERELDSKVHLDLIVTVSADWVEDESRVRSFHGLE